MKYTGRIISIGIYIVATTYFKIGIYLKFGYIPISEFIGTAIFAFPIWWVGKKYDDSKYYFKELQEANKRILKSEERLKKLAFYDPLTGVCNRRLFEEKIIQAIKESKRYNRKIAIFYIDIDDFKEINDCFGHDIGDEILKMYTYRIRKSIRATDILSRIGGDEFTLLLPEIHHLDNAVLVARKILNAIQDPYIIENKTINITSSIGISIYEEGEEIKSLIKRADKALYKAKESGKNTFSIAT
jgi:diguanylate cyclase (GGDEF)-like protein